MKRWLLPILFAIAMQAAAQEYTVVVQSSLLSDSLNNAATGTLIFRPTLANGTATGYQKPGGGQATSAPVLVPVSAGVSSVNLPNTALTNPANICFSLTFSNGSGAGLGPGYNCLQPAWNNYWCTAGVCNLDNFDPNLAALPIVAVQPPGPLNPSGGASPMITLVSSLLSDSANNLATGTLILRPALADGTAIAYRKGGGGQTTSTPIQVPVSHGVVSVPLPDTALTSPQNICINLSFRDPAGDTLGPGYTCLQPTANNYWCTAGVCNLDNFVPNLGSLATVTTGPVGPAGPTGPAGTSSVGDSDVAGQTASQGSVNLVGTVPATGKYRISYYAAQHALCASGSISVTFTFNWVDSFNARSANSISLTVAVSQSVAAGSIQGIIPVYAVASTAITYTSTVTGSCATGGPASYDAHISVENIQ